MSERTRLVYSTGAGRICPECGQPDASCRCTEAAAANEPVPERITAVLRLETKGRGGKAVTVVDRLPNNAAFLDDLAGALKRSCATGGTVRSGAIELAGDVRERVRPLLAKRGYTVKG
jgi:translation initiation factor 1